MNEMRDIQDNEPQNRLPVGLYFKDILGRIARTQCVDAARMF